MNTTYETAEAAAKRFSAGKIAQGFLLEALHTYTDIVSIADFLLYKSL